MFSIATTSAESLTNILCNFFQRSARILVMNDLKLSDSLFTLIAILFCSTLVLTNVMAVKLFQVPFSHAVLSGGDLLYPISFLLTDIVAEIWGKKRARFLVAAGFMTLIFTFLVTQVALSLPPHPAWVAPDNPFGYRSADEYQNAFASVFHVSGIMVFASATAYLVSQSIDIRIFHALKRVTSGRHLWLRNNASTMISQSVDSFIFTAIYFYFGLQFEVWLCLELLMSMIVFKIAFALIDTPLCYWGVSLVKRLIQKDALRFA